VNRFRGKGDAVIGVRESASPHGAYFLSEYVCSGRDVSGVTAMNSEILAEQAAAKGAFDSRIASKGIVESLREWILKLEEIERAGAGTPDTCDMIVCLQQLLDELDRMFLERSHKQLN
jgi:hypothetical protein